MPPQSVGALPSLRARNPIPPPVRLRAPACINVHLIVQFAHQTNQEGAMRETKKLTISEAREQLTSLPEQLDRQPGAVAVTRRGKPVLALLPWDVYESLVETLEIMGDEALMAELRQAMQEVSAGEAIDWERALKEL